MVPLFGMDENLWKTERTSCRDPGLSRIYKRIPHMIREVRMDAGVVSNRTL